MDLPGASQSHAHTYRIVRKHPAGHRRARQIAIENGLDVDAAVTILRVKDRVALANTNAHASYLSMRVDPNATLRIEDRFPGERVVIWMHRSVFLSDESIVAHLAHELYEIQGLRLALTDVGGAMLARDIFELIRPGKAGNLHDRAWDNANRVVEEMRL